MIKKISTILLLLGLVFTIGCANPYVRKLKAYEMQLSEGRDEAFFRAMEMTEFERLDVEDQFSRQGLENALLISAYVRDTGKTPEDMKGIHTFSYDEVLQIIDTRNAANNARKEQIRASYRAFFSKIKEEDAKIKAIHEGVKKAEEVRQETYVKIGETLGTSLATAGIVVAQ